MIHVQLDELSHSLSAFHALRMPHLHFGQPVNTNGGSKKSSADKSVPKSAASPTPSVPRFPPSADTATDAKASIHASQASKTAAPAADEKPVPARLKLPVILIKDGSSLVDSPTSVISQPGGK
jgi:hypothetical protein